MRRETPEIKNTLANLRRFGFADRLLDKPYPKLFPDEPFFYGIKVEPFGHGYDFFERDRAIWRAIGENLERTCQNKTYDILFKDSIVSSYSTLQGKALNPITLAGFSDTQKEHVSILQYDSHTKFRWVSAQNLKNDEIKLIPYQLVDRNYRTLSDEPLLRWPVSTGLATANDLETAICKGLLEVIERDAFMITYLNRLSPPCVDLKYAASLDDDIAHIYKNFTQSGIEPRVTLLATDAPVHVGLGVLTDVRDGYPTVATGARASFSLKEVIVDSLTEALANRLHQRYIYNTHRIEKPFKRIDRLMYWAQKKDLSSINFLFEGTIHQINKSHLQEPPKEYGKQLPDLLDYLQTQKYESYFIRLTPSEVEKSTNLKSVFVVVPKLQPLHLEESVPYLGGERLKRVPEILGYMPAKTLNSEPHPFV